MSSSTLCRLIRAAVIAAAAIAGFIVFLIIPHWGRVIREANPEFAGWFWPWLMFIWATAVPCFVILVYVWRVAGAVGRETVFTLRTAGWIKTSAILLFADAGFFFAGNVVFLILQMTAPPVLFISMFIDILAISLALLAAVLARYVTKAAALQEESEGTI